VRRSSEALQRFGIWRREMFVTGQRFRDFAELAAKLRSQGDVAPEGANRLSSAHDTLFK